MAIPRNSALMHHVGDVAEAIPMGIHAEDFPFLAETLNSLYSNPIAALIREYSTNAWDSHVDAGVIRPIEITLPTWDSPEFIVQDFGLGMSVADLRSTYAFYGASNKRDSDAVAGQLGLGSKSGLSYATSFVVTAVKDHEKVVAQVTKDERGLGVIQVLIPPAATDEANGVRITIPVERDDIDDFHVEATNLFQFWTPGTVLIDGEPPEIPEWVNGALHIDDDTWLVRKNTLGDSHVIMGNVAYPVPDAQVGHATYRFVARLNIGDVEFVPSREAVKHTPWTDETLSDLNDFIRTNFRRVLNDSIAGATSLWEEAQIKMLWKDTKGTILRSTTDRRIWTFQPDRRWGRKSEAHNTYSLSNLIQTSTVVITGFSAKNVSAVAKERLIERFGSTAFFVILPVGTRGTHLLDGRPNVHSWESVVGATTKPKAARGSRGPKVETIYTTTSGGMTADDLAALDGKVLLLFPNESATYGNLDATVVMLYSTAQEPRIRRYVPNIILYTDEVRARIEAASKAITAHDRRIAQARTLPDTFASLDPDKVADPELAEHIRLSRADDTPTMQEASRFRVAITHDEITNYAKRYPLAAMTPNYYDHIPADAVAKERLFYVNARYNANKAEAFTQALTQGAA